jgi:hypothetical protein
LRREGEGRKMTINRRNKVNKGKGERPESEETGKNIEEIGARSRRRGRRRRRMGRRRREMEKVSILVCESNSPNVCYILPQGKISINVPPVLLKGRIQAGHTLGRFLK